ncbi:MAG: Fic family protein [Deltaproteobacteria bacterium]|nr:Fic family protein [Deltaproteobacteria bacterium]
MVLKDLLLIIDQKCKALDDHRPFTPEFFKNIEAWFRIELTYTSNAIEGNTLTRQETALVVEKGLTVAGKTLVEQLEAVNHARAFDFIATLCDHSRNEIAEKTLLDIHAIILHGIDDNNAGVYRRVPVRISGSTVVMPNPLKISALMQELMQWLHGNLTLHPATIAADAHLNFVSIHPFVDGNGRAGRLLMDLLLMQTKLPPALIRKEDRLEYIKSIESAQLGRGAEKYYHVIYTAIIRSLDEMLQMLEGEAPPASPALDKLLKIGALAMATGETTATIRHWTKEGLLRENRLSQGGYHLYAPEAILQIEEIRRLQKEERLTLAELKVRFKL